jgi:hypothetical protein
MFCTWRAVVARRLSLPLNIVPTDSSVQRKERSYIRMSSLNIFKVASRYALGGCLLIATNISLAQDIPTRFGSLKIDNDYQLLYKGKPLVPEIRGNNGLSLIGSYQLNEKNDIVLLQDVGGSACPALFLFVTVSSGMAKSTSPFGSCSDLAVVTKNIDSITVTMPGYKGPFESKTSKAQAEKQKVIYVFKDGALSENGKLFK